MIIRGQQLVQIMKYMKSQNGSEATGEATGEAKKVDWNDFNYPCCLNLFHYNSDQTPEPLVGKVRILRINHLLIILTCLWNFINNIVDAAAGVDSPALRIVLSIFTTLIWFPISLYMFYIPYRVHMGEDDKIFLFYILSFLALVFYSIWSIADFADANGWVMMAWGVSHDKGSVSFFSFFTSLFSTLIVVLTIVNLYKFCKRDPAPSEE